MHTDVAISNHVCVIHDLTIVNDVVSMLYIAFCRRNCRSFIPRGSGCATCNPGYISPPECCDCDTVGNATHAFYKTPTNECLRMLFE